ncbi:hypothetical protein [Corynebacterium sp. USCH3]|uniref:hypothetical protein n=1 Tax=Corynebacterium sp. USCH3 TaxID=3024840 RepID=UPI00403F66D1
MPDDSPGTANTMTPTGSQQPQSRRVRVVQLVFLALAVVATFCLAWWQWGRWSSGDGSYQNLGYALQWPTFGLFFIFAYRRYMEYERDRAAGNTSPAAPESSADAGPHEIPQDILPTRDTSAAAREHFEDDRRHRARQARTSVHDNTARTDREER